MYIQLVKKDAKVTGSSLAPKVTYGSQIECAGECMAHGVCWRFVYNASNGSCRMYAHYENQTTPSIGSNIYEYTP